MGAWVTVGIIVGCVLLYVAAGVCAFRLFDLNCDGIDSIDEFPCWLLCLFFGPLALVATLLYWSVAHLAGRGWLYRFTHPTEIRRDKKRAQGESLLAEATRYQKLAANAPPDERVLLRSVADDYRSRARELGAY